VISGFRHGVREVFVLLGCYATLLLSYCLFGTAYSSHLQGSSCPRPP